MLTSHAIRLAIVFAVAGVVCRFTLRHVETRWQIVGFWCVIFAYQFAIRPALGRCISLASVGLDLLMVTLAIVATKVAIEGKITH